MRSFSSSLMAMMAIPLAMGTALPAVAAPAFIQNSPKASADIVQVQIRGEARQERRAARREDRPQDRLERRGTNFYYNGRRGYRERRAGYRQHNGWWFPAVAFTGVIIGGGIGQPAAGLSTAHVQWCHNRWRSYQVSNDSYQPYNGPRQLCVSPYTR